MVSAFLGNVHGAPDFTNHFKHVCISRDRDTGRWAAKDILCLVGERFQANLPQPN